MIRYALNLTKLSDSFANLDDEDNYYDILVLVFLRELEQILQRGLLKGYQTFKENNSLVKGRILFKENIILNYNRPDRIYCSFDELSTDILENRIIKLCIPKLISMLLF